jgi:hypothetical protein
LIAWKRHKGRTITSKGRIRLQPGAPHSTRKGGDVADEIDLVEQPAMSGYFAHTSYLKWFLIRQRKLLESPVFNMGNTRCKELAI